MTVRVAIVGLGSMGRLHARKIGLVPGAALACVVDPDVGALGWDGLPDGTVACRSIDDAADFDAAIVATPPATHFAIASLLLDRGVHCLVEKPVCTCAADARRLTALAREKGLVCASGHLERFNPALLEVIRRAGPFLYVEAERMGPFPERSTDADAVQDLMIHDLDALCAFEPGEPVDVRAVGIPVVTDKVDIANARIEFSGGSVASLTASRVSMDRRRKFRVFSRRGYFSADLVDRSVKVMTVEEVGEQRQVAGDVWRAGPSDALLDQDVSFVQACLGGGPPATDAALSIPALVLADTIRAVMRKA